MNKCLDKLGWDVWCVSLLLAGVSVLVGGCGRGETETLEHFQERWYEAVNTREADPLYDMLDSSSQWQIRSDLEKMRGLDEGAQRSVLDQLGGVAVKSLSDLTPRRYFSLLWHKATDGQRPMMSLEASGAESAYMILKFDEQRRLRVRLVLEGGRWTWKLPKQSLGQFRPPDPAAPKNPTSQPATSAIPSAGD